MKERIQIAVSAESAMHEMNKIQGYLRFTGRRKPGPFPRRLDIDEARLWLEFSRACYALDASL